MRYLPIVAFKEAKVCSFHPSHSSLWFESSGTTNSGRSIRSRHWLQSHDLYQASVIMGWKWFLEMQNAECRMQDIQSKQGKANFVGVMPSFQENPHSSLSCMVDILMREFGDGEDFWCMKSGGWDWCGFCTHLQRLEREGQPTILFGIALGWVHFLDWCKSHKQRFHLPPSTLILETGGYKGHRREFKHSKLHRSLSQLFGVNPRHIQSEYSMCELSSQAYSFSIKDARGKIHIVFRFPPWCRYRVVYPDSSMRVPKGKKGVLEIQDLANLDSCAFLRTEDLVVERGDGFEWIGRLPKTGLKGCSLALEDSAELNIACNKDSNLSLQHST